MSRIRILTTSHLLMIGMICMFAACSPAPDATPAAANAETEVGEKKPPQKIDPQMMFVGDPASKALWERINDIENIPQDELGSFFDEAIAYLESEEVTAERLNLVVIIAQVAFRGQGELHGDACQRIADVLAKSDDEGMRARGEALAASARGLRLIGKSIEVEGQDIEGESLDWGAYQGKVVLIDYWATWCGACIDELPNLMANYERFHEQGFEVVGIAADRDREAVAKFLEENKLPWVNLFDSQDAGHPMALKYNVVTTPTTYLLDRQGKIVSLTATGAELGRLLEEMLEAPAAAAEGTVPADAPSADSGAASAVRPANVVKNSIDMELILIPAGEFLMGSSDATGVADCERPRHRIEITQQFLMGAHEVTQGQYEQVMGINPSETAQADKGRADIDGTDTSRFPVDNISWNAAVMFCNRLSQLENRTPCYSIDGAHVTLIEGDGYRLPTEAEWEYACRAGTTTRWHFGNEAAKLSEYAWFNAKRPGRVGTKKPNGFGLYDMYGNVWELCQDWYDDGFYQDSPAADPTGPPAGKHRVIRGGSWYNDANRCHTACRDHIHPVSYYNNFGFRVARVS